MGCFDPSILLDRVWSLRDSIWKGFKTMLLLKGVHMVAYFITPFIWQSFFCLSFTRSCTVKNLSVFGMTIFVPFRSARKKKNKFFAKVTVKHLRGKGNFTEWGFCFLKIWLRFGLPSWINVWYPPWAFTTMRIYNGWPNTFWRPFRCGSNYSEEKRSKVLAPFFEAFLMQCLFATFETQFFDISWYSRKKKTQRRTKKYGKFARRSPILLREGEISRMLEISKKFPTWPTERTPKKPEYLIAGSQLTARDPLVKSHLNFWWKLILVTRSVGRPSFPHHSHIPWSRYVPLSLGPPKSYMPSWDKSQKKLMAKRPKLARKDYNPITPT